MASLQLPESVILHLQRAIWVFLGLQILCALITFGGAAGQIPILTGSLDDGCLGLEGVPNKVGYSIFIGVFTCLFFSGFIALQYFRPEFCIPFKDRFSLLLISSSVLFTVFWIAATGSAFLTCEDLASVAGDQYSSFVQYGAICCDIRHGTGSSSSCSSKGLIRHRDGSHKYQGNKHGTAPTASIAVTQSASVFNMLFFITTVVIWVLLYLNRPTQPRDAEKQPAVSQQDISSSNLPGAHHINMPAPVQQAFQPSLGGYDIGRSNSSPWGY